MTKPPSIWENDVTYVDASIIREKFAKLRVIERARLGELHVRLDANKHATAPAAPEPYCTRSQLLGYYELDGTPIAQAHQYVRPDGSLGASGQPDPRRLFDGPTLLGKLTAKSLGG